jgi:hypothetical protein
MTEPHAGRGQVDADNERGDGTDVEKSKKNRKQEQEWMDGRAVYIFPEARPSNVAKRNIVSSDAEHDSLTQTHVRTTLARRALSTADIENEIAGFRKYEAETREADVEETE